MKFTTPKYLSALFFGLSAVLGSSVIVGWLVDIALLYRLSETLAPMQFNNALCFVLIGLSGILVLNQRLVLSRFFSGLGLLLSGLTLVQYPLGIDIGIDLLFFNTNEIVETAHPGRMAPNSALGHLLGFIAVLFISLNQILVTRIAGVLGVFLLASGFVSLVIYGVDTKAVFEWGDYTKMAVNTSLGFVLLGMALVFLVVPKERAWARTGKIQQFYIWPYLIVLLIAAFFAELQLPQDVATGLLYAIIISTAWFGHGKRVFPILAAISTLLIVLDIIVTHGSFDTGKMVVNRTISIISAWFSAFVLYYFKLGNERLTESQEKLKNSEKRFNLAVQGTTAGLWDWMSIDNDAEWWSPKFYELLGYQIGEINPSLKTFSGLLHPDDKEMTFKMVDRHFKRQAPFVLEYRLKHKSGKYRWFLGSGQATWDEDGNPQRMVGTIVDIHARKMAEIAEIDHARALAEKNKELQELTYVASHDLQEPVRTIASFVNLFEETYSEKLDDEAKQYLDFMKEASSRSQQLIIDLLDYSRIGKDKELTTVDLSEVVNEVLTDLSARINETNAKISVGNMPEVTGHGTELRLVFQNLITNAIKFQKKDSIPEITISSKEDSEFWTFSVSDNGIGIDSKYLDRIFVIFRRLHGKSAYEGTGIGLAHCKKVIELHQGKIWVESEPGKGSTFHFTIPTKQTEP